MLVVSKQDTLSWEVTPLLSEQVIVKDASEYAASMPVNHLLPHWVQTNRYYYDGGSVEMRDAGICVREDDWDGAFKLWNAVYEKAKGVRKMRAAFNIALYHEMRDDIRKASEWAEKALQLAKPGSRDEVQINIYRASLQEAEAQLLRLNVQMKRFNDKN